MNIDINEFVAGYHNPLDRYIGHHDSYTLLDVDEYVKPHRRYTDDELLQMRVLYDTGANRTWLARSWDMKSEKNIHALMRSPRVRGL